MEEKERDQYFKQLLDHHPVNDPEISAVDAESSESFAWKEWVFCCY